MTVDKNTSRSAPAATAPNGPPLVGPRRRRPRRLAHHHGRDRHQRRPPRDDPRPRPHRLRGGMDERRLRADVRLAPADRRPRGRPLGTPPPARHGDESLPASRARSPVRSATAARCIGARVGQGVGAALILPTTLSTLNAVFVGRQRAIAFAVWGSTIGGMAAVGPLVGGWLTTDVTWRWAFWINIPVGLVVIALDAVRRSGDAGRDRAASPRRRRRSPLRWSAWGRSCSR